MNSVRGWHSLTSHICHSNNSRHTKIRLAVLPGARGLICSCGMVLGAMIDVWQSPSGAIAAYCGGDGSLSQQLFFHTKLMPFAHAGMLLGVLVCGACRYLSGGYKSATLFISLVAQAVLMVVAECILLLLLKNTDLFDMIIQMVIIMVAVDMLGSASLIISNGNLKSWRCFRLPTWS